MASSGASVEEARAGKAPGGAKPNGEGAGVQRSALATRLYSALFWPYLFSTCALFFFPALGIFLATAPFDKKRKLLHRYTCWWGGHYLAWAPLAGVRVEGRERLGPGPYVFVSNHQSMVDILAVFATNLDFLWVSKIENFYAPFLGWNMALNGYIPLKRGYLPSIMRMVRMCHKKISAGHSLFVFPEGTRSPDGEIKKFYRGAFLIAARNKVPVVPLVLEGTNYVLPKHSFRINPQRVLVRILDPVDPAEFDYDHRRLHDAVRDRMVAEQQRLRRRG